VCNFVSDNKGGKQTKGLKEQSAEENSWAKEGRSDGKVEKTA
jgi:hypothetical protein